tara:strand:+ start:3651 stop:4616 length:966 start_codon:yes stop_codon:yes gene_type:complete
MKKKYSIGIGLNLFNARALLLSEDSKVVTEVKIDKPIINANDTIKILLELFEDILSKSKKYKDQIEGVGLALGGIVNSRKGIVFWPQGHDSYISLPFREHLEKRSGLPVFITNDASACAWAEYNKNFLKCKNVIYMFSGVGCGIIADGKLYSGRDGAAGELFLNPQKVMNSSLGEFSILKQWPVDINIVKRTKELIALGKATSLVKKISPTGELKLSSIFSAAKKKDRVAREVIKEAAFSLGVKASLLINIFNPDVVIIGGGLEEAGEILLEECIASTKKFAFNEMRRKCKIFLSQLGAEATSLGAAMLVFQEKAKANSII